MHLSPQIADVFRLFTITYYIQDSSEFLSGKWYASKKVINKIDKNDSIAGSFIARKIKAIAAEKTPQPIVQKKKNISSVEDKIITKSDSIETKYGNKTSGYAERKDNIIQTIKTNASDVSIEIYDNGEIDGDSISLYVNDKQVIYKKMLNTSPIQYSFKAEAGKIYKITIFAENLGRIPPNTAYMIIKTATKEWRDIYLSTDFSNNASIVISVDDK